MWEHHCSEFNKRTRSKKLLNISFFLNTLGQMQIPSKFDTRFPIFRGRGNVNSNMTKAAKAGPLVHCALYWRWFVHSTAHHHGLGRYRPQLFLISPVPTVTSGVKVYLLTLSWVFYCRLIIDTMILMTVYSI